MNLVIDIGNTRTKFFHFNSKDELEVKKIFVNNKEQSIVKYLRQHQENKIIVSSSKKIPKYLKDHSFLLLDQNTSTPISLNYTSPKTLGSDRIALAVGANTLFPQQNCLIIGTGTCITFNLIDKHGVYQGGGISPGLALRLKSLNTFTDKLPLIEHKKEILNYQLIGNSTQTSIESGVFNGAFAEIEGIIYRYREVFKDLIVILTGGDQELFAKNLKSSIFAISNIQAIGLNRILNYNV